VDADNNYNLLGLHWASTKRFWRAVWCAAGWKPGEVSFAADYTPIPVSQIDLHAYVQAFATAKVPGHSTPNGHATVKVPANA
ncbi:MAG TPA: fatty acid hydroxylase, partial [Rhodanobacter sp.]|nr:fatty acid hydroxylase [Rhodanobacter sp.]